MPGRSAAFVHFAGHVFVTMVVIGMTVFVPVHDAVGVEMGVRVRDAGGAGIGTLGHRALFSPRRANPGGPVPAS
jgi:hypothetical protein